jgi:hypothetical protein
MPVEHLLDYGMDPSETATFRSERDLPADQRLDVWYCDGTGYSVIGDFELHGEVVRIACCGKMDWRVGDDWWRCAGDIPLSIDTDKKLRSVMEDQGTDIHMNCWIEVFEPGHPDEMAAYVVETIDEALDAARELAVEMRKRR